MTSIYKLSRAVTSIFNLIEIGKRIKEIRGDLKQKDVAAEFGVERSYVSNIEQGRTKPSFEFVVFLAKRFNTSIDWILLGKRNGTSDSVAGVREADQAGPPLEPELALMINYLIKLWKTDNPDIKGWMKIQFRRAFPDFEDDVKKPLAVAEDSSNYGG